MAKKDKQLAFTTSVSHFKRKGDVTCYTPHLRSNGSVDAAEFTLKLKTRINQPEETAEMLYKSVCRTLAAMLVEGKRIETDEFAVYPTIKGRFDSATAAFDPSKGHTIGIAFYAKGKLRTALAQFDVVNATAHVKVTVSRVRDESSEEDDVITSGEKTFINGEGLTLVEGREDEFVALLDPQQRQLVCKAEILESNTGMITCRFPAGEFTQGEYILQVCSRNGGDLSLTPFTAERTVTAKA